MILRFISLLTGFCSIFLSFSSIATSLNFFSPSYKDPKLGLIAQTSTNEDIIEEMLIEGMEKGITGDYQGAIAQFTEVIRLYPDAAEAYYNRGFAYTRLGNYQAAMADYNQAIAIDPTLAQAYLDRGQLYYQLDKPSEALKDLQRAANLFKQQGNTIAYNQTLEMMKKLQ